MGSTFNFVPVRDPYSDKKRLERGFIIVLGSWMREKSLWLLMPKGSFIRTVTFLTLLKHSGMNFHHPNTLHTHMTLSRKPVQSRETIGVGTILQGSAANILFKDQNSSAKNAVDLLIGTKKERQKNRNKERKLQRYT